VNVYGDKMSRCGDCANHSFPTFMRNGKQLGYCIVMNCPTYVDDGNSCLMFAEKITRTNYTDNIISKLNSHDDTIARLNSIKLKDNF